MKQVKQGRFGSWLKKGQFRAIQRALNAVFAVSNDPIKSNDVFFSILCQHFNQDQRSKLWADLKKVNPWWLGLVDLSRVDNVDNDRW